MNMLLMLNAFAHHRDLVMLFHSVDDMNGTADESWIHEQMQLPSVSPPYLPPPFPEVAVNGKVNQRFVSEERTKHKRLVQ